MKKKQAKPLFAEPGRLKLPKPLFSFEKNEKIEKPDQLKF